MPLRPDPLKELLDLQERMNRLFDETLGRERLEGSPISHGSWMPVADVFETPGEYLVELELPGLAREDVVVQAQGDELVVRGERRCCPPGRPESFHRLERRHGPFARGFRFGQQLDPEGMTAELSDGLLRIRLPKLRKGAGRVPVERGD